MDINVFSLCLTLLSAGLLAYLCAYQPQDEKTQNKKSSWQSLGHWAALFVCIASVVFLSTAAGIYWNNQEDSDFWNLATIVFTFFGVLLTAGAAFATVAAVISYFSVNKKLKKAKSSLKKTKEIQDGLENVENKLSEFRKLEKEVQDSLKKAQSSLNEFEKLDQERRELRQELETLASYQAVVRDLQQYNAADIDKEMQDKSLQVARQILDNPQAGFEARLRARVILKNTKTLKLWVQTNQTESDDLWNRIINKEQEIVIIRKILSQTSTFEQENKDKNNYAVALFNYGTALGEYGKFLEKEGNKEEALKQWEMEEKQYKLLLEESGENNLINIDALINLGFCFHSQALVYSLNNLDKTRMLWEQAKQQYEWALKISPDNYKALGNLGIVLANEARVIAAIGDLEAVRALWKTAGEKYGQALGIKADKHEAAHNWFVTLVNEAAYLSDTDQIQLWQNAHAEVLKLQNHSPKHQQSKVIQDLLNDIANATVIQFPQQEPTP